MLGGYSIEQEEKENSRELNEMRDTGAQNLVRDNMWMAGL